MKHILLLLVSSIMLCACGYNEEEMNELISSSRALYTSQAFHENANVEIYAPPSCFIAYQNLYNSNELSQESYSKLCEELANKHIMYIDIYLNTGLEANDTSISKSIRERSKWLENELKSGLTLVSGNRSIKPSLVHYESSHGIFPYERAIVHFSDNGQTQASFLDNFSNSEKRELEFQSDSLFGKSIKVQLNSIENTNTNLNL